MVINGVLKSVRMKEKSAYKVEPDTCIHICFYCAYMYACTMHTNMLLICIKPAFHVPSIVLRDGAMSIQ